MAEKMLVTQALDERDLLVKKISDKIEKLRVVDAKKRNEDRTFTEHINGTTSRYCLSLNSDGDIPVLALN